MNRTNVKMQLPFRICDRCSELNVDAKLHRSGIMGGNTRTMKWVPQPVTLS